MKFTDGFWVKPDQYTINAAIVAGKVMIEPSKVTIYAPTKKIVNRGDTLNLPVLMIEFTTAQKNIIRVKTIHHKGSINSEEKVSFDLNNMQGNFDWIEERDDSIELKSGDLIVKINKESWQLSFYNKSELLVHSFEKALAQVIRHKEHDLYHFRSDPELEYHSGRKATTFMKEELSIMPGEYIYGLGERFGAFIKNGQSIDVWNEDGGTSSGQSYKSIPFYLSNRGYGVFVNHAEKVSFEVGSEKVSRVQFSVANEELDYFVINGPSLKDVLVHYTDLTGKPALPPAKSFGLWLSTSFCTNYDEKTVLSFIKEMKKNEIAFDTFHFDCFWMSEFEWCSFIFDQTMFPSPGKLIQSIREQNINACLWINPYIGQQAPIFDECMKAGYFLKRIDGSIWQTDLWQAGMAMIDFTNPLAVLWYKQQLKKLLDLGVNSFKTDFGERVPTNVIYHNGANSHKMHNYYSYLYNKVVFDLLKETLGQQDAIVFARSATVGSQQFPVHWGGDNSATYASMAESLRGGLSFTLSGFGFWSHDISGFEDKTTEDIYRRWSQFGFLSTHTRYHGNMEYKVPWLYGEKSVEVAKKFSHLKNRLMPYLYRCACETSLTGIPMMRAMVLEFPEDFTCHSLDRQYMLGDSLLVAPIFNDAGRAHYYLPAHHSWTNILTNEVKEGGQWYNEDYDYLSMPLFAKSNSLIIYGHESMTACYDYTADIEIHSYALTDHSTIQTDLFNHLGGKVATLTLRRCAKELIFNCDELTGSLTLVLHHHRTAKIEGGLLQKIEKHNSFILLNNKQTTITLI